MNNPDRFKLYTVQVLVDTSKWNKPSCPEVTEHFDKTPYSIASTIKNVESFNIFEGKPYPRLPSVRD